MAETPFERYLSSVKARVEAEKCPRCGGAKVHDFEHGCWVQDRCTECQATWFNDPPRLAGDALEGYYDPSEDDKRRVSETVRASLKEAPNG